MTEGVNFWSKLRDVIYEFFLACYIKLTLTNNTRKLQQQCLQSAYL